MEPRSDPSTSTTVLVGIVSAVLLFLIIVCLQAVFYNAETAETVSKTYRTDPEELSRLRAEQLSELHTYRWIDQNKGITGIPIDRAMKLVVQEMQGEGAARSASPANARDAEQPTERP